MVRLGASLFAVAFVGAVCMERANADETKRRFELMFEVTQCNNLAAHDKYLSAADYDPPDKDLNPYGLLYLDDEYISASLKYFTNTNTATWNDGSKANFLNRVSDLIVNENIVSVLIISYLPARSEQLVVGWLNVTLPPAEDLLSFNETLFGSGTQASIEQTRPLRNVTDPEVEDHGTCTFKMQLRALQCDNGEFLDRTRGPCQICPRGYMCPEGFAKWMCRNGTYTDKLGQTECKLCAGGYQCLNGATHKEQDLCPRGMYSREGAGVCSECSEGYYGSGELPAITDKCDGVCDPGYMCPSGSTSSMQIPCTGSNAKFCEKGEEVQVRSGYHSLTMKTTSGSSEVSYKEDPCPTGFKCSNGEKIPCPAGTYQDEYGQVECKPCSCEKDMYASYCGGSSKGVCALCAINADNFLTACEDTGAYLPCPGDSLEDNAMCLSCDNVNATDPDTDSLVRAACANYNGTAVAIRRISVPVLAGSVVGFALFASLVLYFFVRKRRQMQRRLAELDRVNKSYISEQELIEGMQHNINPMMQGKGKGKLVSPDLQALEKLHDNELSEIESHKRALEDEVRRLKKQAQLQYDHGAKDKRKTASTKKKEFRGGTTLNTY